MKNIPTAKTTAKTTAKASVSLIPRCRRLVEKMLDHMEALMRSGDVDGSPLLGARKGIPEALVILVELVTLLDKAEHDRQAQHSLQAFTKEDAEILRRFKRLHTPAKK